MVQHDQLRSVEPRLPAESAASSPSVWPWSLALTVGLLALLTFAPALRNGLVNWDDDKNLIGNPHIGALAPEHVRWMFTTFHGGHYQPLTWLSYAADYRLWGGLEPFGFHLTSILLHAAAAVIFYFVALRLLTLVSGEPGDAPPRLTCACAALSAALFSLHPLRVESVVWLTERRDVLSGVLLLGGLAAWLRAVTPAHRTHVAWYLLALLLYLLSLLSKAAGMTLPLVLLVLDAWPLERHRRHTWGRLIVEKLPFLAAGVAAGITALLAQQSAGAVAELDRLGIGSRLAIACRATVVYMGKWLIPTRLSPLYALPPTPELFGTMFLFAFVVLTIVVALAVLYVRRFPAGGAALVAYLILLAPVSGLAQSGRQMMADRYTYLAMLPWAVLAGGLLQWVVRRRATGAGGQSVARTFAWLAGLYVAGLVPLTVFQTTVWHDSITLWSQAVACDPRNSVAHTNLAQALWIAGQPKAALGPFLWAVELDPRDAVARNGLAATLLGLEQPAAALVQARAAVDLAPDNPQYRYNLAFILAGFAQLHEAAEHYSAALAVAPGHTAASEQLAAIQAHLGEYAAARGTLRAALSHAPASGKVQGQLAWLLATCPDDAVRDGAEARKFASVLAESTSFRDARALDTLAAALAATGDFSQAEILAHQASELARRGGNAELADEISVRAELYAAGQPYRESPPTDTQPVLP